MKYYLTQAGRELREQKTLDIFAPFTSFKPIKYRPKKEVPKKKTTPRKRGMIAPTLADQPIGQGPAYRTRTRRG